MGWNLARTRGPSSVPNFTPIDAICRPCGAKNLKISLWVNQILARCSSRNTASKNCIQFTCATKLHVNFRRLCVQLVLFEILNNATGLTVCYFWYKMWYLILYCYISSSRRCMHAYVMYFRPHHSTTYVDAAYCYRPSSVLWSVCLSVGWSVTL